MCLCRFCQVQADEMMLEKYGTLFCETPFVLNVTDSEIKRLGEALSSLSYDDLSEINIINQNLLRINVLLERWKDYPDTASVVKDQKMAINTILLASLRKVIG